MGEEGVGRVADTPASQASEVLDRSVRDVADLLGQLGKLEYELSEKERDVSHAMERHLLALLDVSDAFERVFIAVHAKEDQADEQTRIWIGNFRTVARLLRKVLDEQQVMRMDTVGKPFDPAWHTAERTVRDPSAPDDSIASEMMAGYMWRNRLLRKAQVVVVQNEQDEADRS
jgi:molecular chaperone GrpE